MTPETVAHQAPLSVGFPRQEYWSELLYPSPGDLPNPGIKLRSAALLMDSLQSESPGNVKEAKTKSTKKQIEENKNHPYLHEK